MEKFALFKFRSLNNPVLCYVDSVCTLCDIMAYRKFQCFFRWHTGNGNSYRQFVFAVLYAKSEFTVKLIEVVFCGAIN